MNSKMMARELKVMGYTLQKMDSVDARWMVISDVLTYHWTFKDLKGVRMFMVDEQARYRATRSATATC